MGKLIVTITCDWDALDYAYGPDQRKGVVAHTPPDRFKDGLAAVMKFHETFSAQIPITHFICPAYFTRGSAFESDYAQGMRDLKGLGDEIALHIHCWRSLVEFCGVRFLDSTDDQVPEWGRTHSSPVGFEIDTGIDTDYGHGVPLGAYSYDEIVQLMTRSRALLCEKVGMAERDCVSFRCGGWMTSDSVFKAVEATGFRYEASAVNHLFFQRRVGSSLGGTLDRWLDALWCGGGGELYLTNRRFRIPYHTLATTPDDVTALQPRTTGLLVEIPDTGVLADYVDFYWMRDHIQAAIGLARNSKTDVYISLGFHLESGGDPRFADADAIPDWRCLLGRLVQVLTWAQEAYQGEIQYLRIAEVGNRFVKFLD